MEKNEKEFYVGYLEKAPKGIAKFLKLTIPIVTILVIVVGTLISFSQKEFDNSTFEFGVYKEITGVIYQSPYPMIRVTDSEGIAKNFLLAVFGKDNPRDLLKRYEAQIGKPLDQMLTKVSGSLIYHDGKTMLELDFDLDSFLESKPLDQIEKRKTKDLGQYTLAGEILDTKCFLGVMKPGNGKAHRSCAVRCIAGGIPPAVGIVDENGFSQYALLVNGKGEPINQEVLPYVGKQLEITGNLETLDDWKILRVENIDKAIALKEASALERLLALFENDEPDMPLIASCATVY
ncbi:MAG: hypothetical protein AAF363_00540 [Bacteroidota bacterium]